MTYQYRGGGETYQGIAAKVVVVELRRIRKEAGGRLHTEDVVRAAKPKNAPLHPMFEWDDGEAGKQYRLWQARQLIRNVMVVRPGDTEAKPLFVNVVIKSRGPEEATAQYYQDVEVIVNNPSELQAALDQSVIRLAAARKSLSDLQDIARESKHVKLVTTAARHVEKASTAIERISAD